MKTFVPRTNKPAVPIHLAPHPLVDSVCRCPEEVFGRRAVEHAVLDVRLTAEVVHRADVPPRRVAPPQHGSDLVAPDRFAQVDHSFTR